MSLITLTSVIVAVLAYRASMLTKGGMVFTVFTGMLVGAAFGFFGLLLLGVFFVSSSLASKYRHREKRRAEEIVEKAGARDQWQVLANGGVAWALSVAMIIAPSPVWLYGFTASLAAAASDTWASELGVLAKRNPRSVLTFRRVEPGTSGAVSWYGTAMSFTGSLLITFVSFLFVEMNGAVFLVVLVSGLIGSMVDTLLGATLQRKFRCVVCGKGTEKTVHHGKATQYVSGIRWLGNDAVNFLSNAFATLFCLLVVHFG